MSVSINRSLSIYDTSRRVQADQEDGTAEIILISQHQAPHSWGFLFVGWWVDLGMENDGVFII